MWSVQFPGLHLKQPEATCQKKTQEWLRKLGPELGIEITIRSAGIEEVEEEDFVLCFRDESLFKMECRALHLLTFVFLFPD